MTPKQTTPTRRTIAKQFGVIKKAPSGAYRTDLADKASPAEGAGVDVYGASYKPIKVTLTAGGK
jgi:hypothetical protein